MHHAFFVHFLAIVARLPREYAYFHVSSRSGTQDNNFLKLPSNIRRRILNKDSCDDRQRFFFLLSAQANYKGKEVSAIKESLLLSLKFIKKITSAECMLQINSLLVSNKRIAKSLKRIRAGKSSIID